MSENVRKLVGVVVMAALVVVGVAVSSGDDTDFTRNSGLDARNVDARILVSLARIAEKLEQLAEDEESRLIEIQAQVDSNSSQLEAVGLTAACPGADPSGWATVEDFQEGSVCVRNYLSGLPLEEARGVVHAHGKFGFFHRFNFTGFEGSYSEWEVAPMVTEEACEKSGYDDGSYLFSIAVDTKDGRVQPHWSAEGFRALGFGRSVLASGYLEAWPQSLIDGSLAATFTPSHYQWGMFRTVLSLCD